MTCPRTPPLLAARPARQAKKSAYASVCVRLRACVRRGSFVLALAYVSIRQHTSAYVSIRLLHATWLLELALARLCSWVLNSNNRSPHCPCRPRTCY
jgi:hypothetical protein